MFPLKIVIFHSYVSLPEGSPLAMVIFQGLRVWLDIPVFLEFNQ